MIRQCFRILGASFILTAAIETATRNAPHWSHIVVAMGGAVIYAIAELVTPPWE